MKMPDTIKAPVLRFAGFSDDWRKEPLSKIAYINPKTHSLPEHFFYIDLDSVKQGVLVKQTRIDKEVAPSRAQRLLQESDIIYQTVRPYQRNNLYIEHDIEGCVASTGYAQLRAQENARFLYALIHTNKFVNEVLLRSTGTNYPAINSSDLGTVNVGIPSQAEQDKIADFVTTLERKRSHLSQKIELLKRYKEGVAKKIFAQKVRFKQVNGLDFAAWEKKRLDEISRFVGGYTFLSSSYDSSGTYHIVTIGNVQKGKMDLTKTKKVRSLPSDIQKSQILQEGDILVSMTGNVGRVCLVDADNCLLNQRVGKIIPIEENSNYLFYSLSSGEFLSKMISVSQGGAQGNLSSKDIMKYELNLPSDDEQTIIATFFVNIDRKIEQEEKKMTHFIIFSNSITQRMFV